MKSLLLFIVLLLPCVLLARFVGEHRGLVRNVNVRVCAIAASTSLLGNVSIDIKNDAHVLHVNNTETITILEPPAPYRLRSVLSLVPLTFMFASWYVLSAGHNIYNVHVKSQFPFPVTTASLQLLLGSVVCALPLYLLRLKSLPSLTRGDLLPLLPIALCNTLGHVTALTAVFQVRGTLTHIIKAAEPVVQVLSLWLWSGVTPRPLTALSLVPVSYGVAHASTLGDLNLHRLSGELTSSVAVLAMISNVAFAMRSIFKRNLSKEYRKRTGLTPSNEHALTTLLSFLLSLPLLLYFEPLSVSWSHLRSSSSGSSTTAPTLYKDMLVTSVCFYLYNSLQNTLLARLDPVSTAVGSALKRVVILVGLYLYTPGESSFPPARVVGCGIAIGGCLLYAIFDAMKM